ncbi:hypothetical protein IAR55_006084 [Kwoniella newhampshirensis]|uniref:Thc1 RRM domain-containing protein n=1 Tax=Kwoniella newhampshirensis TaxID=1651941 RepID=A0AAW0YUF8_9TREE
MSISLPNGTILAAPSSSQVQLSAAVTRILHLANFSPELKTRDLQLMFKEWENEKGGFRIKWLDDVNALVVFADASVAKRAYLSFVLNPPSHFRGLIRPYDRPDAAQIIQSLASRSMGHRTSMSNAMNGGGGPSMPNATFPFPTNNDPAAPQVHSRAMSVTNSISKHNPTGSISLGTIGGVSNGNTNGNLPLSGSGTHVRGATAPQRIGGGFHQRTGSASSSWARGSMGGGGSGSNGLLSGGVLSFANVPRLPTHSESSAGPVGSASRSASASSSSGGDPVVIMDPSAGQGWKTGGARRESVSAEKALREVQKALASVEAQG